MILLNMSAKIILKSVACIIRTLYIQRTPMSESQDGTKSIIGKIVLLAERSKNRKNYENPILAELKSHFIAYTIFENAIISIDKEDRP